MTSGTYGMVYNDAYGDPDPVFPDAALGVKAEIELSGGWTDITDYVAHGGQDGSGHPAAITLQRGRPDEQTTSALPVQASFMLNNIDGRFTTRNPLGPYYPDLTRNTPIRFSIPNDGVYLRIIDDLTSASCSGTPDSAGLSITGDTEIQVEYDLTDWSGGFLADKWGAGTQQSWIIQLNRDGTLYFFWSTTGADALNALSTMPIPMGHGALKITMDVNNGASGNTVTFYTSDAIGGTWTQLGDAVIQSGTTSIFDSTTSVRVGRACVGKFYGFQLLSGIGGTVKASPDFTSATAGASSLTDAQGNVWTIGGTLAEYSDRDYRYYGELSSLPTTWDVTGQDVWVQVTAGSLLRRMSQGQAPPVMSAMARGILGKTGTAAPHAYWTCEDMANATSIASALSKGPAMKWSNGTPTLASDDGFLCSNSLPVMNGAIFSASVPNYTSNGSIVVRFLLDIPSGTSAPDGPIVAVVYTTGGGGNLKLSYTPSVGNGEFQLFARDGDGGLLFDSGVLSSMDNIIGSMWWVSIEVLPSGGNINCNLVILAPGSDSSITYTHTISSASVGKCASVHFNENHDLSITDWGFGHVSVQSAYTPITDDSLLLNAWTTETAANRFIRLCNESDLTGLVSGYPDTSVAMGPQLPDTLLNLIQQCEDADRGQIYEPRDMPGFAYRTLASMTNQAPQLTLDYSADNLGPPLSPTDDDQFTVNDVTAQSLSGSSARTVLDDGSPMSISPPPVGVGDYGASISVNVADDSQLPDEAGWVMNVGTVNEERYPSVVVDLAVTQAAVAAIAPDVKALDIGDYFEITNTPAFMPPGPVKALTWGIQEVLGDFCYEVTLNAVPESPYEVAQIATGLGKADTIGSSLHADITSSATSISVDTTDTFLWTTTSADWPIDIFCDGEQMTVTAISGSSSPQTFTVTRSVNGVVKAHTAGDAVALFRPSIVALTG